MIILADIYNEETGEDAIYKFNNYDELYEFTFSPAYTVICVFTTGKIPVKAIIKKMTSVKPVSDREKIKAYLREFAYLFQVSFQDGVSWSYGEIVETSNFFERYGKRFGLLTEFKEEGII